MTADADPVTIKARWLGHRLTAEAVVASDPTMTLGQAAVLRDRLAESVRRHCPQLDDLRIHIQAKEAYSAQP